MTGVGEPLLIAAAIWTEDPSLLLVSGAAALLLALVGWIAWRRTAHWKREAEKTRTTLDAVAGSIIVLDAELRIVDLNLSARRTLGFKRGMPRKENLLNVLSPAEAVTPAKLVERIDKAGHAQFEATLAGKGDESSYVRARLKAMDIDGRKRVVVVLEDISEERQQAAQYEAFLEYLIKQVPVEVTILAPDGRYLYLSSSLIVEEAQREWLLGRTDFDYCRESGLHVEVALRRRSHRMEVIDRCESVFFEEEIAIDGTDRRFAWRYCPYVDDDGEVSMVLGFGLDQTELGDCKKELGRAREECRKASRLKEALLRNISHEIRTPLSSIIGTAQMLKSEVPQGVRDFLENIEDNGHRLAETLNDMLDLAGLQAENLEMRPEILNLSAEMEEVGRSVRSVVDRRDLFLEVSAPEPEILVRGDRNALFRCVKSLVDNAVKFTSQGGILVDVSKSYEYAYIRVMDTGVGIDEERQRDVFEAFSQEDTGDDRSFEGVGLGLTVTKRLLAMMDGDIRVHSRKGSGSSFVVRLPLVVPELRRRSGLKARVLVADEQRESHRMLKHMLGEYFEFESAFSLPEAAELTNKNDYDVVFVDTALEPGAGPSELLAVLRESGDAGSAIYVLVDQHRHPGRRAECLEEGWTDYVSKPLNKLELLNALYSHTGHALPAI